jgi:2-amino-4-hydroxy-6-hydroxymethyldihydropteridine diphosphokinase
MTLSYANKAARTTAFLGLGSNLAAPLTQLTRALREVEEIRDVSLKRVSSFYETAPVGMLDQPNFVNAVAEIETTLSAPQLLKAILDIEAAHARVRVERNGPRTLDIDILLFGDEVLASEGLSVPHPRMHERAFVLIPLVEVRPDAVIPGHGLARACLARCDARGVWRADDRAAPPRQAGST